MEHSISDALNYQSTEANNSNDLNNISAKIHQT